MKLKKVPNIKMKLKKVPNIKKYVRKLDPVGEWLVMFEIEVANSEGQPNCHYLYDDNRKPPLDIAINPKDGMIEYITYFAQDETIEHISTVPVIVSEDTGISISIDDFDKDYPSYITEEKSFKFWYSGNTIFVLKDGIEGSTLTGYKLNNSDSLLFLEDEFVGIEFKNMSQEEMTEIRNAKIL